MTLYACPKCADEKNLLVSVETMVLLVQTDDDEYGTDAIGSDQWWNENNYMTCRSCGWEGCTDDAFKENKVRN
jgi:hypothetical protein